eukprot:1905476-Prymnesium_polylepis.1
MAASSVHAPPYTCWDRAQPILILPYIDHTCWDPRQESNTILTDTCREAKPSFGRALAHGWTDTASPKAGGGGRAASLGGSDLKKSD